MEQTCNGPQCKRQENTGSTTCNCESCICPGCSETDPIDFVMAQWHQAAMQAMLELKKEKIKEKIAQSHGELLDKGSDAVVEAIEKMIQSMVQKNAVQSDLRGKIASILREI